jgi:hypothetical protein
MMSVLQVFYADRGKLKYRGSVWPREFSRTWQLSLPFSRSLTVALLEQEGPLKQQRVEKNNIQLCGVDDCPCTFSELL